MKVIQWGGSAPLTACRWARGLTLSLACCALIACDDEPSAAQAGVDEAGSGAGHHIAGSAGAGAGAEAGAGAGARAGVELGGSGAEGGGLVEDWSWRLSAEGEAEVLLEVSAEPFSITLRHPHGAPVTLSGEMLGFGTVTSFDESQSYDPYLLHHDFLGMNRRPSDLAWLHIERLLELREAEPLPSPSELEASHLAEPGWALRVALSNGREATLRLHLSARAEGRGALRLTLMPPEAREGEPAISYGFWEAPAREGEEFYGLGESFDQVPRRGTYRAMGFEVLPDTESGYNEGHVPVPLLISTQGVAYFFETHQPSYFDVAYERPDRVRAEQGRPTPLALQLMWSAHPFEALKTYYELTGAPLVPPYWSFAPHYWRNVTQGQEEVEADLATIRELKMPAGVFWIDRPYQRAYNDCTFDPARYDDPQGMRQRFAELGFKLVLWHAPYTSEASDAWERCDSEGYFVSGPLVFMNFGKLMDLTNPGAIELWGELLERFNELDVAGYKLDYAEDIQIGVGGRRLGYDFANGEDDLTMHHRYATFYHRAYLRTLPPAAEPHAVDAFIMGRSSAFGGQQYTHAIWPGDLDSDYRLHLEEGYWVGGLPASVVAGLTLGASGFPFFAADTGGFRNERPTQEVLTRWAWQSAFSPIMQIGGGGTSHFPWAQASPDEPPYDERGVDWMREATRWNIRLADYRFTWGLKARETGAPLMRPFGMSYPHDGRHPSDTYLLGPELLIAPAMSDEGRREVPLPEGLWYELLGSALTVGPASLSVEIPLGAQAVFVRAGAIIPLLDERTETLTPVSQAQQEAGLMSRALTPGALTWLIALEGAPHERYDMRNHDGAELSLLEEQMGGRVVFKPAVGSPGLPAHERAKLELRSDPEAAPFTEQLLDGEPLPVVETEAEWERCDACLWRPRAGQTLVRLPPHHGAEQLFEWR